jgi:hypothetical protein
MSALAELQKRWPHMFGGAGVIGYTFHSGWMPRFVRLCADVDALLGDDKRGFHWIQTKEKFGVSAWYFEHEAGYGSEVDKGLRALVKAAMQDTATLCIVCGRTGALNRSQSWALTLCPEHAKQHQRGDLEHSAFEEYHPPGREFEGNDGR